MSEVRVRIAPSPTGPPHMGTGYIALFNYIFAKFHKGKMLLRVEDTDQKRSRPQYEKGIIEALKWLGIKWDEGPDVGGPCGPYRQSERTELYRQHAERLLVKDGAYRCFCPPERLEKMREEQRQRKAAIQYDGKCRTLSESVIGKKLKENVPFVVRLKVPKRGKLVFQDWLRGPVTYDYKEIDDQVLLKTDGYPTYHLANVVDDHLMQISHVIRGEEWLSSTPKHVLLYELFGWDKPEFIHMPLLLNPDGSKLSKRKNPTSIFYYRDAGYLPEAMINYLCMMGYSRPNGEEKFTLEEMIQDFDIKRISLGGSVFDLKKLGWLSGKYIRENLTPQQLQQRLTEWRLNQEYFTLLMPHLQLRMDTLGDFIPQSAFLLAKEVNYNAEELLPKGRSAEEIAHVLQTLLFMFEENLDWNEKTIEQNIVQTAQIWEWKIREVTGPLFVGISGSKVAPPLYQSMALLGKDMSCVRVVKAIEKLGGISKDTFEKIQTEFQEKKARLTNQQESPASPPPEIV